MSRKPSLLVVLLGLLVGCRGAPPARGPRELRSPPEIVVRTSRFALVASARVEFEASPAHGATFDEFLLTTWPGRASTDRGAMDGAISLLLDAEDLLAARLATALDLAWSADPLPLVITSTGAPPAENPLETRTLEVNGACFRGAAVLQCAFYRAVRDRQAQSGLLVAIEKERARLDDPGKDATASLVRDVATFAVGEAVRSVSKAYDPERHFPIADAATLAWLAREWPRRLMGDESAPAFGARAVHELAAGKP